MSKIAYTNRDFDSLLDGLKAQVPVLAASWTNLNEGELGVSLLRMMAGIGDMISYLMDRQAEETFLPTAILRDSIQKLTALIDYQLSRPVAAKTTLRFSLQNPAVANLLIPKYTQVKTADGLVFTTHDDATIFVGQTFVDVDGYQGEYVIDNATGNGQDTQSVRLSRDNIAQNFLDVLVGNVLWTEDTSDVSPALTTVYVVKTDVNERATVQFNSFLGSVPPQNTPIVVNSISTKGAAGNIGAGLVTKLVSTIPNAPLGLSVTNTTIATGGKDRESIDEARVKAPRRLRSLGRACTLQDYQDLLETFPKVSKAQAIDHNGYAEIYVMPADGAAFFLPAPVVAGLVQAGAGAFTGGTYKFAVTALDAFGETSDWEYNPADRALLDRGVNLTLANTDAAQLTITNVPGALQYKVYVSNDGGATWKLYTTVVPDVGATTVVTVNDFSGAAATLPAVNGTGARAQAGSQSLRQAAEAYIEGKRTIGTVFALFNPVLVPVDVTATVKIYDNYLQTDVKGRIQTALTDFLAFGSRDFADDVALSDIYATIMGVEGVRSVQLIAPADDVVVNDGELASLGTVTLTMVGGVA